MLFSLFVMLFLFGVATIQCVISARLNNELRKVVRDQDAELKKQLILLVKLKDEKEFCSNCKCESCEDMYSMWPD